MGIAPQLQPQFVVRLFHLTALAAQIARTPVHFAQAVENRAPNTKLGIGTKLHMLAVIELVQGIHQTQDASVNQVFKWHMARQPFMDAARDIAHLRQLFV